MILKLGPLNVKAKFEKRHFLFRSDIGIIDIIFKRP